MRLFLFCLLTGALAASAAGAAESECQTAPAITEPAAGTAIVMEGESGPHDQLSWRLGPTTDEATLYSMLPLSATKSALKQIAENSTFYGLRGVLPVSSRFSSPGSVRERTYEGDPLEALQGLRVGESTMIKNRETFSAGGKSWTLDQPVRATFLGCFTEAIAGEPQQLLKYRIAITSWTYDSLTGKATPVTTDKVVGVSQRFGWVVYEKTSSVIKAVKIAG